MTRSLITTLNFAEPRPLFTPSTQNLGHRPNIQQMKAHYLGMPDAELAPRLDRAMDRLIDLTQAEQEPESHADWF
jgi:hypothetical protein